ncbi:Calcium-transporting ATPase 3 [Pseudocercospora fuligena]|uniref:P-type Na(+) transporter n=1 Tax=Pseudocercospora fuligena TaxID=685502 RepID=A0A8H6R6A8_9PEZI|nr:Calcium-transporting ATPase 3 [Pseudocercospora fuligena]
MEKPPASSSNFDVGSQQHSTAPHGPGGLPAADDSGNVDDPPPIPSAGSSSRESVLMNDKACDGARDTKTTNSIISIDDIDISKIHDHAHTLTHASVASLLATDVQNGLTDAEVNKRREQYGLNRLEASDGVIWWRILIRQVSNSLTIVLAIAMILSYATMDWIEGGVISAVILLNIIVGFFQDYRAEQTIASLLALSAPDCKAIRDGGSLHTIKAEELVPGDLVQLAVGDKVPADVRLLNTINFASDEGMLTGESKPASKDSDFISSTKDDSPGDRQNMAFSATTVTRGRATGVVVGTGMNTVIGQIAESLKGKKDEKDLLRPWYVRAGRRALHGLKGALGLIGTPLQVKLSWFALFLFALAILLAIIVFSANVWDIDDETLIYGICVAVAVIPESLIAVLTITMAVGSKAMAKGNVVVRKMGALEAIGGVTNICSDKTGTLTQGKMLARKAWLASGRTLQVEDAQHPFDPTVGVLQLEGRKLQWAQDLVNDLELRTFFQIAALCNVSTVSEPKDDEPHWTATGEPTEIALHVMAMRCESGKMNTLSRDGLRIVTEHSFDSSVKRMTAIYEDLSSGAKICYTKGATEVLLPLMNVNEATSKDILAQADAMATEGLRVLCLAHRRLPQDLNDKHGDRDLMEQNLEFIGLVGIYDPPRLESAGAIKRCQAAGITVHMLTGDHLKTATTIAREIGILAPEVAGSSSPNAVMTASEFDKLSEAQMDAMDILPLVIARCSPATKLSMLHALKRRGKYCVMTGDGVNDSPALKGADVGVAMGINGSDVSKEAADMVLTDDNFASIVSAIREGRRLFDNIRKFLLHLLISNIAQVILLLIGLAFKDRNGVSTFPLSPLEILFANLVSSSFLAIGLGLEEASSDVMTRPPHSLKAGVFTWELIIDKFIYGTCMGSLCLASFCIVAYGVGDGDLGDDCNHNYNSTCDLPYRARGTAYSILTVLLSVMAWEAKHLDLSLFNMYPLEAGQRPHLKLFYAITKNKFLLYAVLAGLLTPFPIIYIPVINRVVFRHLPLTWEWGLVFGSIICFVGAVESWKAVKRRRKANKLRRTNAGSVNEKQQASV